MVVVKTMAVPQCPRSPSFLINENVLLQVLSRQFVFKHIQEFHLLKLNTNAPWHTNQQRTYLVIPCWCVHQKAHDAQNTETQQRQDDRDEKDDETDDDATQDNRDHRP